jgi:hypothetical protein
MSDLQPEIEYLVRWQRRGQRTRGRTFTEHKAASAWCAALWDRADVAPLEMLQAYARVSVPWAAIVTHPHDHRPSGGRR